MRQACVQLVESFGDHSLQWGEEGGHRLKMAVMYLLTGIKLGKQAAMVKTDLIGLNGADKSFASALSAPVGAILASVTSSSATVVLTPEEQATAAAAAAAVGAKGGKGAAAGTPSVLNGPNGRDALFLLMNTLRECDPLWLDGYEEDLAVDLHSLLKKDFPAYAQRCSLAGVPDPAADITGAVAPGSVSALWIPTQSPPSFTPLMDENYEDTGLYPHVVTYFLLGNELTAAAAAAPVAEKGKPPAKGAPTPTPLAPSADPILTKAVLYKAHLGRTERRLRNLRDKFIDSTHKNFASESRACAEELGGIVADFSQLLVLGSLFPPTGREDSPGDSSPSRPPYEVTSQAEPHSYHIEFRFAVRTCKLTVTEGVMQRLADVFSYRLDSDAIMDNELCVLIRAMFGHGEHEV